MPGGLVRHYQHQRDHTPDPDRRRDAERVLEDLRSLCRAAQAHEEHDEHATLTGFLEHAAGLHAQELDAASDRRITVSTIHRAKGTEAQAVALLGCEEELLPSWRSISSPDPERLAEERRLFYVAATRAKDRLLITHVAERGRRPTGGPSRFLTEAGLQQTADLAGRLTASRTRTERRARRAAHIRQTTPQRGDSCPVTQTSPREPARPHPRGGGRPVPPAVRARRDRLSRDDQGAVQRPALRRRAGRRLHRRPVGDPAAERGRARPLAPAVPVDPGRVRPGRHAAASTSPAG